MAAEIKIFGERNTGTNALKVLIEANSSTRVCPSVAAEIDPHFQARMNLTRYAPRRYRKRIRETYIDSLFRRTPPRMAWKHTATRFGELQSLDGCPIILMTRHPASWLLGLHRHPYHALIPVERDFAAFLRSKWRLVKRDNLGEQTVSPPELWNAKARSYLELIERLSRRNMAFQVVRFEDFVVDQKAVFDDLKTLLRQPAEEPVVVTTSTKESDKNYQYYQEYYGGQKWREEIGEEAHRIIDGSIDWGVARDLSYA
jgi:hypothetical protein